MHSVGIICEYNPFHNGHLYHLNKVKELFPNSIIILIMSGHFMQRGDVSVINKWDKTKIALEMGIDLVVELPFAFASQAADFFAFGAISILNALKVNNLVFGSELGDIKLLQEMAKLQISNAFNESVKEYLNSGVSYPTSLARATKKYFNQAIDTPNDLLAISYLKAINKLGSSINPITIKRTNDYHNTSNEKEISSATSIRIALQNKSDVKKNVPDITYKYLNNPIFIDDYFEYLKYKIISTPDLSVYQTVDEGLENRIKKAIIYSNTIDELIKNIKTKRYTYNKIKRMLAHILCGFTKEEANKIKDISYIRLLGFNSMGQKYLNSIKKDLKYPLITKYHSNIDDSLDIDYRTTLIYCQNNFELIKNEYKPIKKD